MQMLDWQRFALVLACLVSTSWAKQFVHVVSTNWNKLVFDGAQSNFVLGASTSRMVSTTWVMEDVGGGWFTLQSLRTGRWISASKTGITTSTNRQEWERFQLGLPHIGGGACMNTWHGTFVRMPPDGVIGIAPGGCQNEEKFEIQTASATISLFRSCTIGNIRSGSYCHADCAGANQINFWVARGGAASAACNCPKGATFLPSQAGCRPCSVGHWMPWDHNAEMKCLQCSVGWYQNVPGQASCKACGLGTYQDQNAQSTCKWCEKGSYQDKTGMRSCKPCLQGFYASGIGWHVCQPAPIGHYQDLPAQPGYKRCQEGEYQDLKGQTSCKKCQIGKYQDNTGQSFCKPCNAGTYQDQTGKKECQPCAAGHFQSQPGKSSCDACPSGTYQNLPGQTFCKMCPVGTYGPEPGRTSCLPAPIGRFQDERGKDFAKVCPAGQFQPVEGQRGCIMCQRGLFRPQSDPAKLNCELCPLGQSSSSGASSCHERPFKAVDPLKSECPDSQALFTVIRHGVLDLLRKFLDGTSQSHQTGERDEWIIPRLWQCSVAALRVLRAELNPLYSESVSPALDAVVSVLSEAAQSTKLPDSHRILAMRLVVMWSTAPHLTPEERFEATMEPPAPVIRAGAKNKDSLDELLIDEYVTEILGGSFVPSSKRIADHLSKTCVRLAMSLAQCECRLEFDRESRTCKETTRVNNEGRWLNTLTLAGYCGTSKALAGSSIGNRMIQRATQCLSDDLWQQRLQRQRLDATKAIYAAARYSAEGGSAPRGFTPPFGVMNDGRNSMVLIHERDGCNTVYTLENAPDAIRNAWGLLPLHLRILRVELDSGAERQVVYFRQKNLKPRFDPVNHMLDGWGRDISRLFRWGLDYDIYSTAMDAWMQRNAWAGCPGSRQGGFPKGCIPTLSTDPASILFAPALSVCPYTKARVFMPLIPRDVQGLLGKAEGVLSELSDQGTLMETFNAVSVTVIGSSCRASICDGSLDDIVQELGVVRIEDAIDRSTETIRQFVYRSWKSLRVMIDTSFQETQAGLALLGKLVVDVSQLDADQEKERMEKMEEFVKQGFDQAKKGMVELFKGFEKEALGRYVIDRVDLDVTTQSLNSVLERVHNAIEVFNVTLTQLDTFTEDMDHSAFMFYNCRAQEEIAKLTNKRRRALQSAIKNAAKATLEIAVAVVTGGGSEAATAASGMNEQQKAQAFVNMMAESDSAKRFMNDAGVKDGLSEDKTEVAVNFIVDMLGEDAAKDTDMQKVKAGLEHLNSGYDFITDPDNQYSGKSKVMGFYAAALGVADLFGVPGAGPASAMVSDLAVYFNIDDMKDTVREVFKKDAEEASRAYDQISEMLKMIADYAAGFLLEYFFIVKSSSPPPGISISQSTSLLAWDELYDGFEQFLLTTQVYVDMKAAAGNRRRQRRLGSLETTLYHNNQHVANAMAARSRGGWSENLATTDPVTLRRSLLRKKVPSRHCNELAERGRNGVAEVHEYLATLSKVINYAKEMHTSLQEVISLARRTKVLRQQSKKNSLDAERWVASRKELEASQLKLVDFQDNPLSTDYQQARKKALDTFQDSLPMIMSEVPEIHAPIPDGSRRFRRETKPDGILARLCRQSQYSFMQIPSQCKLSLRDMMDASNPDTLQVSTDSNGNFNTGIGEHLRLAGTELSSLLGQAPPREKHWLRIPVALGASLRKRLQGKLEPQTTVQFNLLSGPLVNNLISCGNNMELKGAVVTLERVSQDPDRHQRNIGVPRYSVVRQLEETSNTAAVRLLRKHLLPEFDPDQDWAAQIKAINGAASEVVPQLLGMKTDAQGRRHVFIMKDTGRRGSTQVLVQNSPCAIDGPLVHGGDHVCLLSSSSDLNPTPLFAKYEVYLDTLANELKTPLPDDTEDQQLVVYLQASLFDFNFFSETCPFSTKVIPPPSRPLSSLYTFDIEDPDQTASPTVPQSPQVTQAPTSKPQTEGTRAPTQQTNPGDGDDDDNGEENSKSSSSVRTPMTSVCVLLAVFLVSKFSNE